MPIVSVLLPVRDGEAHLPEAIASIAGQTLDDFEVIAVDDGSRDATPEILRRWAWEDGRVRVIHHPPQGIADALETARHAARGRYLARMDADDIAMPDRLARQLAAIEAEPSLVAVGSRIRYFPRGSLKSGARRYERWINALSTPDEIDRDLFVECPLPHPTFFLRASAVEAAGGYHDAGWPEDYDLLLRLWEAGGRFANVPEVLLRWREHPGRLSRTAAAYSPDAFRRCKARYLIHTLLRRRNGVVVWGAGPTGKGFARALRDAGVHVRGFVELAPRKIGKQIHGAPVIAPDSIDDFRGAFCVAAVGQPGARAEIRAALRDAGWRELVDFVAVA